MPASRPFIGITAAVEPASYRVWRDVIAVVTPHTYVRHVQQAGGIAVLVPPMAPDTDAQADEVLDRLDGLVIVGGVDVEPSRYGQEPHATVQAPRRDRDDSELALVQRAVQRDLPLLGVCRGMQVMAVAAGGALVQHLPDKIGSTEHSPGPASYGQTAIRVASGSRLASVVGERVEACCYHHQGVATHPGYVASAWASDGTLEAMEASEARWRIGVQWHPEVGSDVRLFDALVEAARR